MEKILCFGDSNTYGFIPDSGLRYDKNTRWTGILAKNLKNKYEIVEAGLNNRNCFMPHIMGEEFCGQKAILKYKSEYKYVIFALGINDLQFAYNPSCEEFNSGLVKTLNAVKKQLKPEKIILLSPAELTLDILNGYFHTQFNKNSVEKSKHLAKIYENAAKITESYFIDLNKIVKVSPLDGLHLDAAAHNAAGKYLTDFIMKVDC